VLVASVLMAVQLSPGIGSLGLFVRLPNSSVCPNDQKADDKTQGRGTGQTVKNCRRPVSMSHAVQLIKVSPAVFCRNAGGALEVLKPVPRGGKGSFSKYHELMTEECLCCERAD